MLNQNSILPIIKPHLSTGAFKEFINTDYKKLKDFTGDFLLGLYRNNWKLSYLGYDKSFLGKDGIYDYFDQEYSRLFEPPAPIYIYSHSGMFINGEENSALICIRQSQDRWLALAED